MDRPKHYIRAYLRQLFSRAWHDIWEHYGSHALWDLIRDMVFLALAPSLAALKGHLIPGLELLGIEIGLILLGYILVVTPARMHRDSLDKVSQIKKDYDSRPDLLVSVDRYDNSRRALLTVKNLGGRAEHISAELSFVAGIFLPHEVYHVHGLHEIPLSSGASRKEKIASVSLLKGNTIIAWRFHLGETSEAPKEVRLEDRQNTVVRIAVISDPENRNGKIEWSITFSREGFTAEQLTPAPAPPSGDLAPSKASE